MTLSLYSDMSDEEIRDCIRESLPVAKAKQCGFCLSVGGYDDDPRELWQIPETKSFFKRLVSLGLISCLEVSTTAKELAKMPGLPGFGALEVWMCATEKMGVGDNSVGEKEMKEFLSTLERSNSIAEATLKTPKSAKSNIQVYEAQIGDAPVRHKGFNKGRIPRWRRELGQ